MSLLVVDDEPLWRASVVDYLGADVARIEQASTLAEARRRADPGVEVILLDQQLPDGLGLSLVPELREAGLDARVLLVTGHPQLDDAVEALRLRIDDYLTKPVELELVRHAVLRSLELARLGRVEARERRREERERPRARLVGRALEPVRRLVRRAAASTSPVLIQGETGVGKTLVAKAIHYSGPPGRPFVHLNCASLPETLVEAELFGVEKGAYTGADQARPGLFELADGGTLFLDEIGEMAVHLQAKLLGVLEEGQARRVGGSRPRPFRVRLVAATHVDLERAVAAGRMRRDLLYRLRVLPIVLPPLRERPGDLPDLVDVLLAQLAGPPDRGGDATAPRLAPGELERLRTYPWPGNVRELRNALERALLLQEPTGLRPSALLGDGGGAGATPEPGEVAATAGGDGPIETLAEVERRHTLDVLERLGGHRQRTADTLGIGVATLRRRLAAYRSD